MPEKISSIEFRVLSPKLIKKLSVAEINKPELYDQDGYPIEGGVMDPRLGVIDPGLRCRTCGGTIGSCQGHFGMIELARPVLHIKYAKIIYKLLKSICRECSRPLAVKDEDKKLEKLSKTQKSVCPHCGAKQLKIKYNKPHTFIEEGGRVLTPLDIRERFEKISDSDAKALGIRGGRPEWLIITLFPVPPITVRPSITLETGERSEDDLTHKLVDMIRINQRLKDNLAIGAPDFIIEDLWELLQYHVQLFLTTRSPVYLRRGTGPVEH